MPAFAMKHGYLAALVLLGVLSACSAKGGRGPGRIPDTTFDTPDTGMPIDPGLRNDGGMLPDRDTPPPPDAHGGYDAEPVDPCGPPSCGPEELCGPMREGDGIDNNCDGTVDEGCQCPAINVTRDCFAGPPDRDGLGTCSRGVMTCTEFLQWSPCVGGTSPRDEICDGADNDCNGRADDGLAECVTSIMCPGTQAATPLNTHMLRGSAIYPHATRSQQWTIECPPSVTTCPAPDAPNDADTQIYFVQSGSYRAHYEVVTEEGEELECDWVIRVGAAGLRVELAWDTQGEGRGNTDVDLHLHRRTVRPGATTGETEFFTADDCYYANCKGSNYSTALETAWALAPTDDLAACNAAPHGEGEDWTNRGFCSNPRLDVDVINCDPADTDPTSYNFCSPENVNVDTPALGEPYRIMVNYFSAHSHTGETNATVNVFCNGELRGTFTPPVPLRNGDSFSSANDNWLVADVVFTHGECGEALECELMPLDSITRDAGFGPPWSF